MKILNQKYTSSENRVIYYFECLNISAVFILDDLVTLYLSHFIVFFSMLQLSGRVGGRQSHGNSPAFKFLMD